MAQAQKLPPSSYSRYFQRLTNLTGLWQDAPEIELEHLQFAGAVRVTIALPAVLLLQAGPARPILSLSVDSPPSTLAIQPQQTGRIDIGDMTVDAPSELQLVTGMHNGAWTIFSGPKCSDVGAIRIRVSFKSLNVQFPLAERAPTNRCVSSLHIEWHLSEPPRAKLIVRRPTSTITCFTKGNHALAFPGQAVNSDTVETTILYPAARRISLKYGYCRDPAQTILRSASVAFLTGISYLSVWLMDQLLKFKDQPDATKLLFIIVPLAAPMVASYVEVATYDRHRLYSGRGNVSYTIIVLMGLWSVLGLPFAVGGLYGHPIGSVRLLGTPVQVAPVFLVQAIIATVLGAYLLAIYRTGFAIKYTCDNAACRNRLYLRHRRPDCYASGRVMCRSCSQTLCVQCFCNYARLGDASLNAPDTNNGEVGYNLCQELTI